MKAVLALVLFGWFTHSHLAWGGDNDTALACIPTFASLSPIAKTAELANIAHRDGNEVAQLYLGRGGFFRSRAYAWTVAELYYDNDRMERQQQRSGDGNYDTLQFPGEAKRSWARPFHRMYDDMIVAHPKESAAAVLEKMLAVFDDSFLHNHQDPKSAEEAVKKLGELMEKTGLTQDELMLAFQQTRLLRESPEMKERVLALMEKTLPVHGAILLRDRHAKDLTQRMVRVPKDYIIPTGLFGFVSAAASGFAWYNGVDLTLIGESAAAFTAAPMSLAALHLASRNVMTRFSSAIRKMKAKSTFGPKEVVNLEKLAGVNVLPTPLAMLPLSISSPSLRADRYQSRKAAIEATDVEIPAEGFNPRTYGMAVQKESAGIATAVLRFQKYAASKEIWVEIEGNVDSIEKSLKAGGVNRGDAVSKLTEPLMRKLGDFETFFQEIDHLREDNHSLRRVNARALTLAKEEKSRRLATVDSLPGDEVGTAKAEREILALEDRIKSLTQNEITLARLSHTLDVGEDALVVERELVESMGNALLGASHDQITDVNQPLDAAAIATLKALKTITNSKVKIR